MSAIDWSAIAEQCVDSIGSLQRGVLRISRLGFHLLFVPEDDRARVEREFADQDITIHGIASRTNQSGERLFLAVVNAASIEKLRAIAYTRPSRLVEVPDAGRPA